MTIANLSIAATCLLTLGFFVGSTSENVASGKQIAAVRADYEDALAQAQREYDALVIAYREEITRLETNEAVLLDRLQVTWDTNDFLRAELDQRSAEVSRYKSLANFLSASAY